MRVGFKVIPVALHSTIQANHDDQGHFHDQLLSGLEDAVVYVDRDGTFADGIMELNN